jgi:molybdate transport system substrate-binding protein
MENVRAQHWVSALCVFLAFTVPASADALRIIGAGSLAGAFTELVRLFPAAADTVAAPEFGPSGLMREKIESGVEADLFASADLDQAHRLAIGHPERPVILFTRNRLCALARKSAGVNTANLLERLLDPQIRLATSTPHADPLGDYTWGLFARAEALEPGARNALEAKAMPLFGGGAATPLLVPGKDAIEGIFLADRADIALVYCSGAPDAVRKIPQLTIVALPPELSIGPAYGMVLLNAKAVTQRFALFVLSEAGQAILKAHGFDAPGYAGEPESFHRLLVQRAGHGSQVFTGEQIKQLPAITQRASVGGGDQPNEWSGPRLWEVLKAAGLIDAGRPRALAPLAIRVTGADGYTAVIALGEVAPAFADRPILIANRLNGAPLANGSLRLIVPGDAAGGRSIRDVVRIEVTE